MPEDIIDTFTFLGDNGSTQGQKNLSVLSELNDRIELIHANLEAVRGRHHKEVILVNLKVKMLLSEVKALRHKIHDDLQETEGLYGDSDRVDDVIHGITNGEAFLNLLTKAIQELR